MDFRHLFRKLFTTRTTATEASLRLFSIPILRTIPSGRLLRQDYYQIPIDPDPNSIGNQNYPSYGLRDAEREPDGYATFSWVHTFNPNMLLTVSPFYHYNGADYKSNPNDYPVASTVKRMPTTSVRNCLQRYLLEERSPSRPVRIRPAPVQLLRKFIQRWRGNFPASSIGVNGGSPLYSSTTNSKSRPG